MSDYPEYPPQRSRKHRLTVGDATFIVTSNVNGNMRWIREVHHVRRHRKGGSADVCIYPNGGRKPSATLASLWSHLGVDPDARWKECAADHPAFPANRSIRTAMDAYDDARKNAAAAAVLTAAGWTWVDDGAGHWEAPPARAVDLGPASIPDTPEVRDILGRPNFWCSPWANVLRMRGDAIPRKAEDEQAAVIRFMLNHYLANGADWAETAGAELDAIRKADSQAVGNG